MRIILLIVLLLSLSLVIAEESAAIEATDLAEEAAAVAVEVEYTEEELEAIAEMQEFMASLNPQTGVVPLAAANATLQLPESLVYFDPKDTERILVEAWGNPPNSATLGMLFPVEFTPFDPGSWAVTIEYQEDGYVSDKDADKINYDDMLKSMKKESVQISKQLVAEGYQSQELIGWAAPPFYDAAEHKLHWAQELKFGGVEQNTLNYNIRVLGRKGVLILNFIAAIDQLEQIEAAMPTVLASAEFDQGSTYADYQPGVDKVAAYGIGALVAGKILAKTGLLAAGLIFLKKFWFILLLPLYALRKKFGKKKVEEDLVAPADPVNQSESTDGSELDHSVRKKYEPPKE